MDELACKWCGLSRPWMDWICKYGPPRCPDCGVDENGNDGPIDREAKPDWWVAQNYQVVEYES